MEEEAARPAERNQGGLAPLDPRRPTDNEVPDLGPPTTRHQDARPFSSYRELSYSLPSLLSFLSSGFVATYTFFLPLREAKLFVAMYLLKMM